MTFSSMVVRRGACELLCKLEHQHLAGIVPAGSQRSSFLFIVGER
jgi:hypothetical protein